MSLSQGGLHHMFENSWVEWMNLEAAQLLLE